MFPHTYFPVSYFGGQFFSPQSGAVTARITSTRRLQLPINCVLAGQQPYKFSVREYEIHNKNATAKVWGRHSSVRNLRGGKPSFTTKTNNRGYD